MKSLSCLAGFAITFWLLAPQSSGANEISGQMKVDSSFMPVTVSIRGTPGGYEGRMKIFARNGVVEVCGIGAFTTAQFAMDMRTMLTRAKLEMNGKPILRNLSFFAQVNSREGFEGKMANCVRTGVAAPSRASRPSFGIDWPNMQIRG